MSRDAAYRDLAIPPGRGSLRTSGIAGLKPALCSKLEASPVDPLGRVLYTVLHTYFLAWLSHQSSRAMATFMSPFRLPQCAPCIRRLVSLDISEATFPFHRQLRGKKKTAKLPHTVKVRLLRDIRGYGRQGRCWRPLEDQFPADDHL